MLVEPRRSGQSDDDARVGTDSARQHSWSRQTEIIVQSLEARLGAAVDPVRIRAEVEAEFATHSDARVRDFVPLLVERRVRSRLLVPPLG